MAAIAAGNAEGVNIINSQFLDSYVNLGGSGITAALMIAMIINSKSAVNKSIRNVATGPAFFNINEPVIFGLPIVLNPIYIIPFILAPIVNILIGYTAVMVLKIMPPVVIGVPWTTPGPLMPFLGTGGNITALIVGFICLAVSVLIYAPFVIAANKSAMVEEEAENEIVKSI